MVTILKHGNAKTKAKCERCNCEFLYSKEDIQYLYDRINAYESTLEYSYVCCPECRKIIKLD